MQPVRDVDVTKLSLRSLRRQLNSIGGFTAAKLVKAVEVYEEALQADAFKFLSFPACIVATGARGALTHLVRHRLVDMIITTCGTLDHDLARTRTDYYCGRFDADDTDLYHHRIHRLGNVFIPFSAYGPNLERLLIPIFEKAYKKGRIAPYQLIWQVGKAIRDRASITYWAARNRIPIIVPAITDGAFGYLLWQFWQDGHRDWLIDVMADEQLLSDTVWHQKQTAALIIGGGVAKHHTIWWNQFKGGLNWAIYITTAVEWDGSLSGARPREAISWGKIAERARHIVVEGDATLLLPLFVAMLNNSQRK